MSASARIETGGELSCRDWYTIRTAAIPIDREKLADRRLTSRAANDALCGTAAASALTLGAVPTIREPSAQSAVATKTTAIACRARFIRFSSIPTPARSVKPAEDYTP